MRIAVIDLLQEVSDRRVPAYLPCGWTRVKRNLCLKEYNHISFLCFLFNRAVDEGL